MLAAPVLCSYGFTADNYGSPSSTPGTAITPGASSVEGSWTQVISSGATLRDTFWIALHVYAMAASGLSNGALLDIGVDPAGGSSYSAIISNILVGHAPATVATAKPAFLFPFWIKAGSSVAVRIQGANATQPTARVIVKLYGDPSHPELVPVGQFSETIGTISGSAGVSFTPGNGAYGSFVDLGATTNDMWWWQMGVQCANGTITALFTKVQFAYGDATNKHELVVQHLSGATTEDMRWDIVANPLLPEAAKRVPGGAHIYVRGWCSSAPNTGWTAAAVGIG